MAEHYRSLFVPEYFRFYWQARRIGFEHRPWEERDFVHLAQMQNTLEDAYAPLSNGLLICDTDAFSVSVWTRRYLDRFSPAVDAQSENRKHDLVFCCAPDFAFVPDADRDGENIRAEMGEWIRERLEERGISFRILTGTKEARRLLAIDVIDRATAEAPLPTRSKKRR